MEFNNKAPINKKKCCPVLRKLCSFTPKPALNKSSAKIAKGIKICKCCPAGQFICPSEKVPMNCPNCGVKIAAK
jgi:hypothetical protein